MLYLFGGIVAALLTMALYVRLAPIDAETWHAQALPDPGPGVHASDGRFYVDRTFDGDPGDVLTALNRVALATPRTRRIAGSLESGRLTYLTRSRVVGFPDYTTIAIEDAAGVPRLRIYARLRFGLKDFGVNQARVIDWLSRSGLTQPAGAGD